MEVEIFFRITHEKINFDNFVWMLLAIGLIIVVNTTLVRRHYCRGASCLCQKKIRLIWLNPQLIQNFCAFLAPAPTATK
jgi:hypothetical protein